MTIAGGGATPPSCLACSGTGTVYLYSEGDDPDPNNFWKLLDRCIVCKGDGAVKSNNLAAELLEKASERRKVGWQIGDVMIPAELEAVAKELVRLNQLTTDLTVKCTALEADLAALRVKHLKTFEEACKANSHLELALKIGA
jgi:hypothetical protein